MADFPIYRLVKGTTLTFTEMDGNLKWLSRTMSASKVEITGSTYIEGDLTVYHGITGSLFGTSSWAENVISASYAKSSSYAYTASIAESSSYSLTASSADDFVVRGNLTASNALITGTLTTQTIVVQTITSSIIYSSGSNIFGNLITNTQTLTGSVGITGSLTVNGPLYATASHAISSSYARYSISASYVSGSSAIVTNLTSNNNASINGLNFGKGVNSISSNLAIGNSLPNCTSTGNIAIGINPLNSLTTGRDNTAIGIQANFLLTTGEQNIAIGVLSLRENITGNQNVAIGNNALRDVNGGFVNTGIGYNTGRGIVTGNYNTILGANISGLSSTLSNNIILADGQGNIKYRWDATQNNIYGNLAVTGSLVATAGFTGSLFGTSSWAVSASWAPGTILNGNGFVKASGTNITYDNSTYYLASNPSSYIALTALSAGTGINYSNITGVITNTAPDQTVSLTNGTGISATGTYPNFTITNTAPDQTVAFTNGTGISVTGTYPNFTVTNTAPNQTVSLTQGGTTVITGTYPNFTITSNDQYTGTVTSVGGTGTVSGLTLTGTVSTTGNLTLGGTLSLTSGNVTTALGYTPYNATNPNGYLNYNIYTSDGTLTGNRYINGNSKNLWINDVNTLRVSVGVVATNNVALFEAVEPNINIKATGATNSAGLFLSPSAGYNGAIHNRTGGGLDFYVGSTPSVAMTIGSNLNVSVGTTSTSGYKVQVYNSTDDQHIAAVGSAPSLNLLDDGIAPTIGGTIGLATGLNNFIQNSLPGDLCILTRGNYSGLSNILFGSGSTMTAYISGSGDMYVAGNLSQGSTRAIKENIVPISNALSSVMQIQGVTYDKKDGSAKNEPGFIAEDMYSILPSLVSLNRNGDPQGIKYTNLTAYLLEAIKEQQQQINSLQEQVNKLTSGN